MESWLGMFWRFEMRRKSKYNSSGLILKVVNRVKYFYNLCK